MGSKIFAWPHVFFQRFLLFEDNASEIRCACLVRIEWFFGLRYRSQSFHRKWEDVGSAIISISISFMHKLWR